MRVNTVRLFSPDRPGPGATGAGSVVAAGHPVAPGPEVRIARPPAIELAATLYLAETTSGPLPGLVVAHGAGSNRTRHEPFCREACSQGFAVLCLDLRGHGESGGAADGPLEDDIIAGAEFLRRHPAVDGGPICYRGSSMGGFYGLKAAAVTATGEGFAAVALLCPASERLMLGLLEEEPRTGSDTEAPDALTPAAARPEVPARWDIPSTRAYFLNQDSLALAAQVRCPVLLVHSRGDDVVPLGGSLALAQHLGGDTTLVAMAGGSHTSAQHDPAIHRLTAQWLLDQVTNAYIGRT